MMYSFADDRVLYISSTLLVYIKIKRIYVHICDLYECIASKVSQLILSTVPIFILFCFFLSRCSSTLLVISTMVVV